MDSATPVSCNDQAIRSCRDCAYRCFQVQSRYGLATDRIPYPQSLVIRAGNHPTTG